MGWTPLRDHPPPKPSFQCPHQTKKGTILLLYEFCIHLHTYQDLKLQCRRVTGQKLRYGRPCPHDLPAYQAPITGLHNSVIRNASFFQNSTDYLMLAQSWKFGVSCCSIALTHPAACTGALVPLTFGHVHRPPFYPICSKRVAIDWA